MASRRCPKCGEDNPAEAVVCWACYTSLTGGPPISANAATKPSTEGPSSQENGTQKPIDPKMMGLLGVLLVGAVLAVVMNTGMLGSGEEDETAAASGVDPSAASTTSSAPRAAVASSASSSPGVPTGAPGSVAPVPLPFTTVIGPNPRYATATLAIVATNPVISPLQARGLAKFARDQFAVNGNWKNMQIVVFSDVKAATTFAAYQRSRRSQRLDATDLAALADQGVWVGAPTFYQATGKRERFFNPSQNPFAWWITR